MDQLSEAQIAE
ncbi:hypothetical protein JCM3775_003302, partial [Rhodotorula graminis]